MADEFDLEDVEDLAPADHWFASVFAARPQAATYRASLVGVDEEQDEPPQYRTLTGFKRPLEDDAAVGSWMADQALPDRADRAACNDAGSGYGSARGSTGHRKALADGSGLHSCLAVLMPRLSSRTQAQPRC